MEGPHYRVEVQEYVCALGGEGGAVSKAVFPFSYISKHNFLTLGCFVSFIKNKIGSRAAIHTNDIYLFISKYSNAKKNYRLSLNIFMLTNCCLKPPHPPPPPPTAPQTPAPV